MKEKVDTLLDLKERIEKGRNEVNAVLDRFQLDLDFAMVLRGGSVEPRISFVPRPPVNPEKDKKTIG